MSDAAHIPDEAEKRARWSAFAWTEVNAAEAKRDHRVVLMKTHFAEVEQ